MSTARLMLWVRFVRRNETELFSEMAGDEQGLSFNRSLKFNAARDCSREEVRRGTRVDVRLETIGDGEGVFVMVVG